MAFENCSFWGGELHPPTLALASRSPVRSLEQARLPYAFPIDFNWSSESSISSPVESLASSNETESEEDDYMALAERIAHSMLDDDDTSDEKFEMPNRNSAFANDAWTSDARKVCARISPPPTSLPGRGSLSTRSWSSNGSANSNSSSQLSSPPPTPLGSKEDALYVLYAAAGEMLRLKMNEESEASSTCFPLRGGTHRIPTGIALGFEQAQQQSWRQTQTPPVHPMHLYTGHAAELPVRNTSLAGAVPGFCKDGNAATARCYQHILNFSAREEDRRLSGYPARPPKPDPKHGSAISRRACNSRSILKQHNNGGHKSGQKGQCEKFPWGSDVLPSEWPLIQATGGSGMGAVFLDSTVSGRKSSGTGVFLPRRTGSGRDTNQKPGSCSSPTGQNASMLLATNQREFTSLPSSPSSILTCLSRTSHKSGQRR